jgi:mRNA-degrading endonuclease RelE of RelBE toxin-antitoxin system
MIKEPAERRFRSYSREIQHRFKKKILRLGDNPQQGKPLRGPLACYWELYFEKRFRIIYSIDEEQKTVHIEAVKHKDEF